MTEPNMLASRLGNCEVCSVTVAKYTCPKCELKTCCLQCINIHKKELDCDGVRNQVKFVPLSKFSNMELQNDYIMLEKISQSMFKFKKDSLLKASTSLYNHLPKRIFNLRKIAYSKQVKFQILPKLFTKHKNNTSYVVNNDIFWRIEWIFVNSNIKILDEKLIDSSRLCIAVKKHLETSALELYKSAGINNLVILMKKEKSNKFYLLDNSLSIQDNLRNKFVLEFPIFYVLFNYEKDLFEIEEDFDFSRYLAKKEYKVSHDDEIPITESLDENSWVGCSEDEFKKTNDDNYHEMDYEYDY